MTTTELTFHVEISLPEPAARAILHYADANKLSIPAAFRELCIMSLPDSAHPFTITGTPPPPAAPTPPPEPALIAGLYRHP